MKRYLSSTLLGLICTCIQSTEPTNMIASIQYYEKTWTEPGPVGYVDVTVTPQTSLFDIQDQLRKAVGSGKLGELRGGAVQPIGERDPKLDKPYMAKFTIQPSAGIYRMERIYSFLVD